MQMQMELLDIELKNKNAGKVLKHLKTHLRIFNFIERGFKTPLKPLQSSKWKNKISMI